MTDDKDWQSKSSYEAVIGLANGTLKFILLANGVAAVTLISNFGTAGCINIYFIISLASYIAGVFCGGLASLFLYVSEYNHYSSITWYTDITKALEPYDIDDSERVAEKITSFQKKADELLEKSRNFIIFGIVAFMIGSIAGLIAIAKL